MNNPFLNFLGNKQVSIFINGKEVENSVKAISAEFKKATNEINNMTVGSAEYVAKAKEIQKLKKILNEHNAELKTTGGLISNFVNKAKKLKKKK